MALRPTYPPLKRFGVSCGYDFARPERHASAVICSYMDRVNGFRCCEARQATLKYYYSLLGMLEAAKVYTGMRWGGADIFGLAGRMGILSTGSLGSNYIVE